jgi:hypothetical protein
MDMSEVAAALKRIARGLDDLAAAMAPDAELPEARRIADVLQEWGEQGLTRQEASALFRKHGFAPQTAGGWARGDWIESRDGLRFLSARSRRWLAERKV